MNGTRSRAAHLAGVIDLVGALNRAFAASGARPFRGRRLGRSHYDILFTLSRVDDATVGGLASALKVTSGAITQSLEVLTAEGLVLSETDPADRRRRQVRLSAEARDEIDTFQDGYAALLSPSFDPLSTSDLAELHRLLRLITPAAVHESVG